MYSNSMAGKNIYDSAVKSWGLEKTGNPLLTKNGFGKFINYGVSNLAANYAFDKAGAFHHTDVGEQPKHRCSDSYVASNS